MTETKTQVSTQTKVVVGLLLAGTAIAAFGAGWVWKVKVMGVSVVNGDTSTGSINYGPTMPATDYGDGGLGDGSKFNTNNGTGSSNSNNTNSGNNTNTGANTNTGGSTNTGGGAGSGR